MKCHVHTSKQLRSIRYYFALPRCHVWPVQVFAVHYGEPNLVLLMWRLHAAESLPVSWASVEVATEALKLTAGCTAYVRAGGCCEITPYTPSCFYSQACTREEALCHCMGRFPWHVRVTRAQAPRFMCTETAPVLEHQNWAPRTGPLYNEQDLCRRGLS